MSRLLLALGIILILGGVGHSAGVIHLYVTEGVPEINRVLLDAWVAEAQILAGILYLASCRALRAGSPWSGLSIGGAVMLLAYAVPFIPVLVMRAPAMFRIPTIAYATLSVIILFRAAGSAKADRPRGDAEGVAV
jgi:hypothetical protein